MTNVLFIWQGFVNDFSVGFNRSGSVRLFIVLVKSLQYLWYAHRTSGCSRGEEWRNTTVVNAQVDDSFLTHA